MRTKTVTLHPTATSNLLANVEVLPTGCWNRTIHLQGKVGYKYPAVVWKVAGKRYQVRANRYAYTLHKGPIPEGLVVDHMCNNILCVNPAHLEAVTQAENNRRKGERQTHCKNGHARTPDNVNTQGNCLTCARDYYRTYRLNQKRKKQDELAELEKSA